MTRKSNFLPAEATHSRAAVRGTPRNSCRRTHFQLSSNLWQQGDVEGTEGTQPARVVPNTTIHIFLLHVATPRAGAAENEQGGHFYPDQHLGTHPLYQAVFRETPWLLDRLTHHLCLQPALLHPKSLTQLHLNNSCVIPTLLAMQTSWPKPNANHLLLPEYVLILLNCCNLQKYMGLGFFNPSPET